MNFSFHPLAEMEFNQAIDYYQRSRPGLGSEFAKEVHLTIDRIINYPKAWPKLTENTRRCLTK